jgi:hypothetical protein
VAGVPFVADARFGPAISGLTIDVRDFYGRDRLVAYHSGLSGSC